MKEIKEKYKINSAVKTEWKKEEEKKNTCAAERDVNLRVYCTNIRLKRI